MIHLWEAEIKPFIPGDIDPFNDMSVKTFILGGAKKKPSPDRIASIYMFKKLKIKNPIYGGQDANGQIYIHPGWNRYIGASLKSNETWLNARICVLGDPWPTPNIKWKKIISKVKGKDTRSTAHYLGKKHCGAGPQSQGRTFLIEKSLNARIELYLKDERAIFNPAGRWTISVDVQKQNGIIPSLKEIYRIVDEISGEDDEF